MANVLVDEAFLADIANAIREKNGTKETYKPVDMAMAIRSLSAGDSVDAMISRTLPVDYVNNTVTSIGDKAFYHYYNLNSVTMPNVERIGEYAFYNIYLTSVSFDKVTYIGNSGLSNCKYIESISFPNLIEIGQSGFSYMNSLSSVNLPNLEIVGYGAFNNCRALTEIKLPKARVINGTAFQYCTALTKIDLNEVDSVAASCFANCSVLATLIIRGNKVPSAPSSSIFLYSTVPYIYVPAALVEEYKASNWSMYKDYIRAIEDYPEITA